MARIHTYMVGFGLSLLLTLIAFMAVGAHLDTESGFPPQGALVALLVVLAVVQLFVQLIFFLHIGEEERPRWNLLTLLFAILVVAIIVGGTLWIMGHLDQGHKAHTIEREVTPQTLDD